MSFIISLLRNILHKWGIGVQRVRIMPSALDDALRHAEPGKSRIGTEAFVAVRDGQLVMVVDAAFDDIPSWVQWDGERQIFSIMQMGGHMDEVMARIGAEAEGILKKARKLLLVSNKTRSEPDEKVMHFVSFLARG